MKLSVVIPTYRRPALLRRCLHALLCQEYPCEHLEIVVVEDGGPGEAEGVVRSLRLAAAPGRLQYVAAPKRGPAYARNVGWVAARGEIVAFTDDDTIPQPLIRCLLDAPTR